MCLEDVMWQPNGQSSCYFAEASLSLPSRRSLFINEAGWGNVATFAMTIRKNAVLDPISRRTVIFPPRPKPTQAPPAISLENTRILDEAIARYDTLPIVHRGDSREIRSIPERQDLLIAKLNPRVYSFEAKGAVDVPGTDLVRAKINAHLSNVLHSAGIRTSTLATKDSFLLMSAENVAGTLEAVFKTRFTGSPKHRYKSLPDVATRDGNIISVGSSHPPYVRFDWRNPPPDEDQVLPEDLAERFIDVQRARETVLAAYEALRAGDCADECQNFRSVSLRIFEA